MLGFFEVTGSFFWGLGNGLGLQFITVWLFCTDVYLRRFTYDYEFL